jgi:hypothetical protein
LMFCALASPAKPTMYQPSSAALAVPANPRLAHSAAETAHLEAFIVGSPLVSGRPESGAASLASRLSGERSPGHILGRQYVEM